MPLPRFACWPLATYTVTVGETPIHYKPEISSAFNERRVKGQTSKLHPGIDICYRMRRLGERAELKKPNQVSASGRYFMPPGVVNRAVLPGKVWSVEHMGTGWFVVLDHGLIAPLCTAYAHILERPKLERGAHLEAGEPVGLVGWSPKGYPFAHAHLEAWDFSAGHRVKVDPAPLLEGAAVL